jgi:SAM-dependent methyltransferase
MYEETNPDMIFDLEKKLPFEDNSVKEIFASMVVEHVTNIIQLINEFHRICVPGAKIVIRVPFFSSWHFSTGITHVRTFNHRSLDCFNDGHYYTGSKGKRFNIKSEIIFGGGKYGKFVNWLFYPFTNHSTLSKDIYCRFLAYIIPALEVKYTMIVVKSV